jgi:hypothetical protein
MTGKEYRQMLSKLMESTDDRFQPLWTIDIPGAMQGSQPIELLSYSQPRENSGTHCLVSVFEKRANHQLPTKQQFPLSLQAQESLGQLRWPFVNFDANIAPDLNDLRLS